MKPRITYMSVTYGAVRPKPQVGDRKCVKGVWYVRVRETRTEFGRIMDVVSNGRPCYKWVHETDPCVPKRFRNTTIVKQ